MSTPFIGEIKMIGWNYAPRGWAFCNGQILPIAQNQALFSLLGTTYGGNGQSTFALPNLQGRMPIGFGNGHILGEVGGETAHSLITSEMPAHVHNVTLKGAATPDTASPANAIFAPVKLGAATYNAFANGSAADTSTPLKGAPTSAAGGNQAHENMPPFTVLNYVIALQGIFPSRN
ncbi:MAG: phage tail protein [Holophagaceae bacterium]|nr:phage tail protein [Holophagaceae bacterium]